MRKTNYFLVNQTCGVICVPPADAQYHLHVTSNLMCSDLLGVDGSSSHPIRLPPRTSIESQGSKITTSCLTIVPRKVSGRIVASLCSQVLTYHCSRHWRMLAFTSGRCLRGQVLARCGCLKDDVWHPWQIRICLDTRTTSTATQACSKHKHMSPDNISSADSAANASTHTRHSTFADKNMRRSMYHVERSFQTCQVTFGRK